MRKSFTRFTKCTQYKIRDTNKNDTGNEVISTLTALYFIYSEQFLMVAEKCKTN